MTKTLKGHVTLKKTTKPAETYTINPKAKIGIEIRDVSLACAASKLIARTELTGVTSFPFDFEFTYDETPLVGNPPSFFGISIRIETDDKLDYITDTRFLVMDEHGYLLDYVDLFVIPVEPWEEPAVEETTTEQAADQ